MASSDPFQQVVDDAAKQTADVTSDQHKDAPAPVQAPPEPPIAPPSNIQVISVEPEPTAPANPTPTPTDANSLNSLIDALMDSSKPQAPPQGTNIIVGGPSAPPPSNPTVSGNPPPTNIPGETKKKPKTGLIIATILILLITLPVGIYFISQQRQLTEQRSKAAKHTCSGSYGTCRFACTSSEIETYTATCINAEMVCCKPVPTRTPTKIPTRAPTSTLAMPTALPNQSNEWGPCGNDSDCKSGLFCGATAKCVRTTAKCPNGALAPDGDPCSCSILKSDGTPNRDARCGCVSGTKIDCFNRSQVTGYTLKQCKGTQTCLSSGNYAACVNVTPEQCTGGEPIGSTPTATKKPVTSCTFPPVGTTCNTTGGTPGTLKQCIFYHCPLGCSGSCGETDPGVWWEFGSCTSGKLGANECGQIDTVNQSNTYCIPTTGCDSKIQCSASCVHGPTATLRPQSTPTNTPPSTVTATATTEPTETQEPTATETGAPTATSTSAPTATSTNEPTATPTTIASCSQSCSTDSDCESGLVCYTGMCRKPECLDETDCSCPLAQEETPTPETPVTGIPSIAGIASALGGIILIIIGLLL